MAGLKLWLVRHAPVLLPAGLCYGASDVDADQALSQQTAQALAALLPAGLPVWVSGLARAQLLARQLQTLRPDLPPPQTDTRLNEMDFGCWEQQAWDAIPRPAFDAWMADFAHHRFGGTESTQMVVERVAAALGDLRTALAQSAAQPEAVWISHAGVIRAAQFVAAHGASRLRGVEQWPKEAPLPGGWMTLELT